MSDHFYYLLATLRKRKSLFAAGSHDLEGAVVSFPQHYVLPLALLLRLLRFGGGRVPLDLPQDVLAFLLQLQPGLLLFLKPSIQPPVLELLLSFQPPLLSLPLPLLPLLPPLLQQQFSRLGLPLLLAVVLLLGLSPGLLPLLPGLLLLAPLLLPYLELLRLSGLC